MYLRKKGKVFSLLLVVALLIAPFSSIAFAGGNEVDTGVVKRAEFFKVINDVLGFTEKADVNFSDVSEDDWFYEDIQKAVAAKYVEGYLNGTIKPNQAITREEVAKIVSIAFGLKDEISDSASQFKDVDEIGNWAKNFVGIVKDKGIMSGYSDGTFGPKKNITKDEVKALVKNMIKDEETPKVFADYHMHMISGQFSEIFKVLLGSDTFSGNLVEEYSGEKIVSLLDEAGIDKAFVLSNSYILGMDGVAGKDEYNDVKKENNYLALQVAKYPDRLIGFFSINPLKDYAIEEIDRCYDELKLPGLKMHFTNSDVDLTKPEHLEKVQKVFSHAAEKGVPILLHFRSRSPEFGKRDAEILIHEVIEKTPNLKIQIAHVGGWGGTDDPTLEVFSTFIEEYEKNPTLKKDNIYFDFSGVVVTEKEKMEGVLEPTTDERAKKVTEMMRQWGLDNIVIGSDWPYCRPKDYINNVKKILPLTDEEIEKILTNDSTKVLFEKSIENGEIRHPDLEELNKTLKDGVDYNTSFSVKF